VNARQIAMYLAKELTNSSLRPSDSISEERPQHRNPRIPVGEDQMKLDKNISQM